MEKKKAQGRPKKETITAQASIETIADGLEILFQLPPLIGLGQISQTENCWPLTRFESVEWAKSLRKVTGTVSDARFKAVLKTIEKTFPWLGLMLVTHQIVTPRIKISLELMEYEKRKREESRISSDDRGTSSAEGSSLFTGSGPSNGGAIG